MGKEALTHKDLAVLLGVSETTIKSYRRKFPGSIPVFSKGKPIRFKPEAAQICLRIRDLFSTGMSVEEVGARLAEDFGWRRPKPAETEAKQPRKTTGVDLSQSFATALGNMAKSMISLNQSQAGMLASIKRLESSVGQQQELFGTLGETLQGSNLDPGALLEAGRREASAAKSLSALEEALGKSNRHFDEVLEKLNFSLEEGRRLRQEQMKENYAILQLLQQIEEQLHKTVAASAPAMPDTEVGKPVMVRSGKISPRVIRFQQPGQESGASDLGAERESGQLTGQGTFQGAEQAGGLGTGQGTNPAIFDAGLTGTASAGPNNNTGTAVAHLQGMILLESAEVPRHLFHLPLVIRLDDGSYMSAGGNNFGRVSISINDVKAMLANSFMPPDNFTLHWEQGAEGLWVVFEQAGSAEAGLQLRCQVREITSSKGVGALEIRKYLDNNQPVHPVEFCRFLSGISK